ncbi:hypothetical protein L0F63_001139, partial [Massospora cicadina]
MAKSDSELAIIRKYFIKPQDRTDDIGAEYKAAFPDVQLNLAQLNDQEDSSTETDIQSSVGPVSGYTYHEEGGMGTRSFGKVQETLAYTGSSATLHPRGCLFVAGYPTTSSDEDIIELLWIQFSRWGIVDNIKLTFTNTGVPFGFVYFEDYRSAETFLAESDRVYIRRSLLRVEDARVNRSIYATHVDGSKVHGQPLALQLERHGRVISLEYDDTVHITNHRGAWLVRYASWDEAISAYRWLLLQGCWSAEWGAQVGQSGQTIIYNLIYVDGLDSRIVDRKMVVGMFQQYGEICSANLVSRGATSFAFIEYYNPLSSFRAIRGCHEMSWLGQIIRVQHYRRSPVRNY